jgi:hypothetical protein
MVAIEFRLTRPALGMITGLLCCTLLIIGFLDFAVGLWVAAATLGLAWIIMCVFQPLMAFSILLLVFVVAYSRLGISLTSVEGPGNPEVVALGDLLWLGLVLAWTCKRVFLGRPIRIRKAYPAAVWAMLPFILMATLLPVIGVLAGDWPYRYAFPGLRPLQWGSFALLAYFLVRQYGTRRVIKHVVVVIVLAAVLHMGYALIQLGYFWRILNRSWVVLDDIWATSFGYSWFRYYVRLTGLLINPNSYGMYSALVFLLAMAMCLVHADRGRRVFWGVAFVAALFGLLFAGSRSAYVGIMVALLLWFLLSGLASRRLAARGLILSIKVFLVGALSLVVLWPTLPRTLGARLIRSVNMFSGGVQIDNSSQLRVEEWQRVWQLYLSDYPFGTWVPASYATGSAVDSYYLVTAIQGTPAFTLAWLVFLGAAINLGWSAWRRAASRQDAAIGLALVGFAGMMAGAGLTLPPMLEVQLIVPFWVLIGVSMAVVDGKYKGRAHGLYPALQPAQSNR